MLTDTLLAFDIQEKITPSLPQNITDPLVLVVSSNFKQELQVVLPAETYAYLLKATEIATFEGKTEEIFSSILPVGIACQKLILISTGDEKTSKPACFLGGNLADLVHKQHEKIQIAFIAPPHDTLFQGDFLLGLQLKTYQFLPHFTQLKPTDFSVLKTITVHTDHTDSLKKAIHTNHALTEGVFFARDLVGEPANILYPESYAQRCLELEKIGLKITVLNEEKMTELGMFSLLGVGQGSRRESQSVILEWTGKKDETTFPIALVGKGVCFDTGGISLKAPKGMWDMIYDMGGSAAVVGTMISVAQRQLPINLVGIIGLVENMPDGNAQRPGDVVTTMAGKTIEVLNTDAEGRLVLADIMWYIQQEYKPHTMIDLATLTGAIITSLGHDYGGLFSNDDGLSAGLLKAGEKVQEKLWRMPIPESATTRLKSRVADLANIAMSPEGGSSTAAAFLKEFVQENVKWAHLDIAGMAWTTDNKGVTPKGATGYGVRLLNTWLEQQIS